MLFISLSIMFSSDGGNIKYSAQLRVPIHILKEKRNVEKN